MQRRGWQNGTAEIDFTLHSFLAMAGDDNKLAVLFRMRDWPYPFDEFVVQTIRTLLSSARADWGNRTRPAGPRPRSSLTCPRTTQLN